MFDSEQGVKDFIQRNSIGAFSSIVERSGYWFSIRLISSNVVRNEYCISVVNNENVEDEILKAISMLSYTDDLSYSIYNRCKGFSITFSCGNEDNILLYNYNKCRIQLSVQTVLKFQANPSLVDMLFSSLEKVTNISELLCSVVKSTLIDCSSDGLDLVRKGTPSLYDVIRIVKSVEKGKIDTVAISIIEDMNLLALYSINISVKNKSVSVKAIDDNIIDLYTGHPLSIRLENGGEITKLFTSTVQDVIERNIV